MCVCNVKGGIFLIFYAEQLCLCCGVVLFLEHNFSPDFQKNTTTMRRDPATILFLNLVQKCNSRHNQMLNYLFAPKKHNRVTKTNTFFLCKCLINLAREKVSWQIKKKSWHAFYSQNYLNCCALLPQSQKIIVRPSKKKMHVQYFCLIFTFVFPLKTKM